MTEFDAIFQWNMTNDEIEAYKLALCYEKEFKKLFGAEADGQEIRRNSLPQRNDPRRSNLFRQCWKMRRETRGLIDSHEYKTFIVGNLSILKIRNSHVMPHVICGDKAWIRYKVWKRKFDAKMDETSAQAPAPSVSTTSPKIIHAIDKTKRFLFERCEGQPTFDKIKNFVDTGIFKFWVMAGKVSQFYVVLSPYIARMCDVDAYATQCSFSSALMRDKCTQEVKDYFNHEYRHESV